MKLLLALALPTVALAAATLSPPQDVEKPAAQDIEPLPPGVAARIDDQLITFEEYKAFLLRLYGAGPLQELILTKLFEREAALHDVRVAEAELDAESDRLWEQYMRRFRGEPQAAERELGAAGFSVESYRAKLREEMRRDLLEERIIRATRAISDATLQMRFEQVHGKGGVRVVVRHVLFTPTRVKADMRTRGVPASEIDDARVEAEIKASAMRVLAQLRDGEEFETVARRESHDVSAHQNAGVIPGYNYDRYGEAFGDAVRSAQVGKVFGLIESPIGLHVVEVTSRTTTVLADVAEELTAELMAAPPTWQERNELRFRLRSAARIQTYR